MPKWIDLSGQMFGFYRVESYSGNRRWKCTCTKCGSVKDVCAHHLRSGKATRCRKCNTGPLTHGQSNSRAYTSWGAMRDRCNNPNYWAYKWYGGKGVKICERWNSFEAFLEDMGDPPLGKSLDRYPDKTGNYEPGNCRWATAIEQARNRSNNHLVLCNGNKMLLTQAALALGILRHRITAFFRKHPDFDGDLSTITWNRKQTVAL